MGRLRTGLVVLALAGCGPSMSVPVVDGGGPHPEDGGPTCGPDSCNGCCEGGNCVTTLSSSTCGMAGSLCVSCQAGATCNNGYCGPQQ